MERSFRSKVLNKASSTENELHLLSHDVRPPRGGDIIVLIPGLGGKSK